LRPSTLYVPTEPKNSLLARNVATNLAAFGVGIAITFVLSPYLIRSLGDARYGAWVLIAELLGYYGLLDLGIRGAVTFHVATYLAREQTERTVHLIASAFWMLAGLGSLAAAGGVGLAFAFPHLFVDAGTDPAEILTAMSILACTIGASLPMEVFSASLVARQRLDIVNAVDVASRILVAVGIVAVLSSGGGLVALSALQAGSKVLNWLCLYLFLKRGLPEVSLHPNRFRSSERKALTSIGSKAFVINIALTVLRRTDLVLVAMFMEVKWVTFYSLGRMLIVYTENAVFEITRAYTPRLTELYAKDERSALNELFFSGTRFAGVIAIVAIAGVWSFATYFLALWVGPEYVSGPLTLRSDVVAFLLGVADLPRMLQSLSRQLIFASGKLTFLMWLTTFEAAVNIVLTIVLVQFYGLAGVAMGTVIPLLISQTLAMPWYMSTALGIPQRRWVVEGLGRPVLVGVLTFGLAQGLCWIHPPGTWAAFALEVLIVCVAASALAMMLVLEQSEKAILRAKLGV
jgi:O-antigen/teichoic acid export membrane protein